MHSSVHVVPDAVGRQLVHLRQVEMAAFVRDDGLWDLEVTLTDRKSRLVLVAGPRTMSRAYRSTTCALR